MKILMVVFQFPPLGGMAVSRIYSFAKYWSRAGYEVTVVTSPKYPFFGDLNYHPRNETTEQIELIEVDFTNFYGHYLEIGLEKLLKPDFLLVCKENLLSQKVNWAMSSKILVLSKNKWVASKDELKYMKKRCDRRRDHDANPV